MKRQKVPILGGYGNAGLEIASLPAYADEMTSTKRSCRRAILGLDRKAKTDRLQNRKQRFQRE